MDRNKFLIEYRDIRKSFEKRIIDKFDTEDREGVFYNTSTLFSAVYLTAWALNDGSVIEELYYKYIKSPKFGFTDDEILHWISELYLEFKETMSKYEFEDIKLDVHKAFESHLSELQNKDKGAFYTPEYITSYMNRECLLEYLNTNDIVYDTIENYTGDMFAEVHLRAALDTLDRVKILEPSVGAGAFLIDMVQQLCDMKIDIMQKIGIEVDTIKIMDSIIKNNVYAVDLDTVAILFTECRLRLLTENKVSDVDENLRQGNTLIDTIDGYKLSITKREDYKDKMLYDIIKPDIDEAIKNKDTKLLIELALELQGVDDMSKINTIVSEYNSLKGDDAIIDFHLEFPEVMFNGGFDIVVGNPPYVRAEKFVEIKSELQKLYPDVYNGSADMYIYFYRRGLNLLKEKGVLSFITSNKWFKAKYGQQFREYILKKDIKLIIDFKGNRVFPYAGVDTNILTVRNCESESGNFKYVDGSMFNREDMDSIDDLEDCTLEEECI